MISLDLMKSSEVRKAGDRYNYLLKQQQLIFNAYLFEQELNSQLYTNCHAKVEIVNGPPYHKA